MEGSLKKKPGKAEFTDMEEYDKYAQDLVNKATDDGSSGTWRYQLKDGSKMYYNEADKAFAVVSPTNFILTCFKPDKEVAHFDDPIECDQTEIFWEFMNGGMYENNSLLI